MSEQSADAAEPRWIRSWQNDRDLRDEWRRRALAARAELDRLRAAAEEAEIEYGARFLVPHKNAGEAIWQPGRAYAALLVSNIPGMAELVQRSVGPWIPVRRSA